MGAAHPAGPAGPDRLLRVVLGMLRSGGDAGGGLAGLLHRLDAGGLGEQAGSWVAHGRNQPISGRELTDALGTDELDRLAARTGLPREETAAAVAAALP
ncbi:MAG: DUF937 domain-containing protein, partial [Streptomycetaceae bacterium]|nr:DUF937 domain-containing protein [Streptomycetaceae bacterium]